MYDVRISGAAGRTGPPTGRQWSKQVPLIESCRRKKTDKSEGLRELTERTTRALQARKVSKLSKNAPSKGAVGLWLSV